MLLAPGEGATQLGDAFLQAGEGLKDALHQPVDLSLVVDDIGTHFEVFFDGQRCKDLAPFGHMADAFADDHLGRSKGDIFAPVGDRPGAWTDQARNGAQRGGFSSPVGADQGNDLTFFDVERDAM